MKTILLTIFTACITIVAGYSLPTGINDGALSIETQAPPVEDLIIFDWETPATSTDFQYFGSTLDGQVTTVINNPNATGVNTSARVNQYIKASGAAVWAGGFSLNPPTVDATSGGMICVDMHTDHVGTLGLKLEGSTTGGSNWIRTADYSDVNQWQTLCFDLNLPGLEDAMTPATGNVFQQLVVFPDFGTPGADVDVTYYLDNIVLVTGGAPQFSDVTFSVDMGDKTDFTTVYVAGQFNDWSDLANPLTDADGDNVWETTINLQNGAYEYKFQLDAWTQDESLTPGGVCTRTTDDGVFTNRITVVTGDITLPTPCYASCYACGESVNITWNVNMTNQIVSDLGVYVAGGPFFGHGDLPAMKDEDGDGTYSITLEREIGFTTDYTFINGLCLPDWGCKEDISGQACAVEPFNDRNLAPVMEDTEVNTCFGECSTDGSCGAPPAFASATFRVDMSNETVGAEGVFLSGFLINSWSPDATPMTDADGNGIYEVTVDLPSAIVEYKFVNSGAFEDVILDDCTIQDPSGQFINRVLLMEANDTILPAYVFESCMISTVATNDLTFDDNLFTLRPSVSSDYTDVQWESTDARTITIFGINGQMMYQQDIAPGVSTHRVDLSAYANGMYIVQMNTQTSVGSQKLIVRR